MAERKMDRGLKQGRLDGEAGEARLTVKQARFALEFCKDGNAKQAAIRAGYSEASAAGIGCKLLMLPHVLAAVVVGLERHLGDLDLSVERIIQEAARVGISDIRELFDPETGRMLRPRDMPENIVRAIGSVKVNETVTTTTTAGKDGKDGAVSEREVSTTTEVKLWDKLRGLELLGKLKGLLKPEVKVEAGDSWKAVLERMHAQNRGGGDAATEEPADGSGSVHRE